MKLPSGHPLKPIAVVACVAGVFAVKCSDGAHTAIQERADTSPVWHTPAR